MSILRVEVPRAFKPLLSPARYKGAYGGRGGAKSHFFAEQILVRCFAAITRVVCIREIQKSLRDSVRQLLVDKIQKMGLGWFYTPLESEIRAQNGSLIIFNGMQSYNAETIKSLEAYDIAWVEEAQTFSQKSLELLRPTIRKEGSELWFSWNPRHRTDPVDEFFRKTPHPEAVSVLVNWRDNPWFPDVLRREMVHDKQIDPELAEHVWEGAYGMQEGAILGRLVDRAERAGRINDAVDYDPDGPGIEISSDLGVRDASAWWFWQRRVGGYALLDFDMDSGLHADSWILRLKARLAERQWKLGRIWLPHDATAKAFAAQQGVTALDQFLSGFGAARCAKVPLTTKINQINAARTIIGKCEFHKTRCERGLDALRAWAYAFDPELRVFSKEPVHDWASHPGDSYAYGCLAIPEAPPPTIEDQKPIVGYTGISIGALKDKLKQDRGNRRGSRI